MQLSLTRISRLPTLQPDTWLTTLTRQLGSATRTTWTDAWRSSKPRKLALLITDLVDFSGLLESLGDDAARTLIQRHNRLLRACLRANGGREVTHTGDGIIAAFASARAALTCAIDIQVSLRAMRARDPEAPLHARIGVHAGSPLPEEGRLFGSSVIVAVRVCGVAPGDSILVSDDAKQWAGQDYAYEDRGLYQLKGFRAPQRLHAVTW